MTGGLRRLVSFLLACGVPEHRAWALAEELHRVKTGVFLEMATQGMILRRPGVRRLVDLLRPRGIRLFVATTGSPAWVVPLIHFHFGTTTFEGLVTGADVPALKPAPDAYRLVLEHAVLSPSEAVAVEDSGNGLRAAHATGLRVSWSRTSTPAVTSGEPSSSPTAAGCPRGASRAAPPPSPCPGHGRDPAMARRPAAALMSNPTSIRPGSLLASYGGVICDLDGVVYGGSRAVPGATDTLLSAVLAGRRVAFATNNASRTPAEVMAHLRRLGLETPTVAPGAMTVVTSAQAAAGLVRAKFPPGSPVLAVGGDGVVRALHAAGLAPSRTPAGGERLRVVAVVQGAGRPDVT